MAQDTLKPAPQSANAGELAKKLNNPLASLISVPFQNNTDVGIGEDNGYKNTMNFQPVIPITLSKKLNLITRYIIPIVSQKNITGKETSQSGLGDASISAFFSPSNARKGFLWGVGPVFLVPTATNEFLGGKKLGVGPSALALLQKHGMTIGALVSQTWSIAGDENRSDVNFLYMQPFFAYNWKSGAGLGIMAEITQNWEAGNTTAFITPSVTGVTKLGKQIISLLIGPRIQVASPDGNGADFGIRAALTFVFPK
ncbi:MAG: hypothetical protein MUF75_07900 [Bacteroidia bacterium]|jgi:hypothetical protein|nr:hypothetical protein [Bacteroidia bacterium]